MVFAGSKSYDPELMGLDANLALMAGIGMTALIMLTVLLNSRKALVYDTDAYYLFAGPYNRKQVNVYILGQSLVHGVLVRLSGMLI